MVCAGQGEGTGGRADAGGRGGPGGWRGSRCDVPCAGGEASPRVRVRARCPSPPGVSGSGPRPVPGPAGLVRPSPSLPPTP